jgi:hypothetical protein
VLGANLGMELESVGRSAEAERLIRARDRARQRHRSPREVEAVLVPAEHLQAPGQPGKERVATAGVSQVDVVDADLGPRLVLNGRAEGAR